MSARRDRIEVVPTYVTRPRRLLPQSLRPHFTRRVAGNGEAEWVTESYATRGSAVRGAQKAAEPEGLWVHVLDDGGRILRMIEPTR